MVLKENACNLRKRKKSVKKPKEQAEMKKPRLPVQQNRFTNILELSTLSASLMQLHDLFGTLILDFSQDPVQMKISDVTGNYELNVPKESLCEFKMKVLLGQNSKGKPAFTIFLGECQCYPELPEGALKLNDSQNDNTVSQIDSIDEERKTEEKVDVVEPDAPCNNIEDDAQNRGFFDSDDMVASFFELFEGNKSEAAELTPSENLVTYETHHITVSESQKMGPLRSSDELIVKMRPKRVYTKARKTRPPKKPDTSTVTRRAAKKRSTYRSNLEGFVKFLMTDRVCGSFLDKMKTPGDVVHAAKRITKQNIVNFSGGREYHVHFSRETDDDEEVKPKRSAHSNFPSNCKEVDHSLTNGAVATVGNGIQVLFERPKPFEKAAFVKQVKKELEEWQARDEPTVNVEIIEDAKSSSSIGDSDSNVVTVYEDPKTSKKLETEFDDASSKDCFSEAVVESTVSFFLDLKENEKPENIDEKHVALTDGTNEFDVLESIQFNQNYKKKKSDEYVAPIPLETTSTADIEAMWMNFVEMFHRSTEFTKKLSEPSQEIVDPVILPEPKVEVEPGTDDPVRKLSGCVYPGQHYLPYFVEESLKRVNSMVQSWRSPNSYPTIIREPQDAICPPQMSNLSRFKGGLTPEDKLHFNPKQFDARTEPPFHRHPTLSGKFSIKKSRIFFNPHVSIGGWC